MHRRERSGADLRIVRHHHRRRVDADVEAERPSFEFRVVQVRDGQLLRRDVDEAGLRAERHRLPVVRAVRSGHDERRLLRIHEARRRILDRPAGLQVDLLRPVHRHERLRRDQLAVGAIDHVEEAVLRRLHQHLARLAVDRQIREHDVLRRGEVPGLARRRLVVPDVLAGVRLERDDRAQEQVVAAAGAAVLLVPRRAVAGADVEQVELRVVGHRVPDRAAAAELPPLAVPGLRGLLENRRFERLRRIAGHGVEAPQHLAGLRVVGGDVAAHAELGAAVADDHLALDDARRAGDRVCLRLIDGHHRPHFLAGLGVERDQPAVERADETACLRRSDAAVDDVAARLHAGFARHLRIVLPQQLAGRGVDRLHLAPRAGGIHHAVDDQRRRLLAAMRVEVDEPREAELLDVARVDLRRAARSAARSRCARA